MEPILKQLTAEDTDLAAQLFQFYQEDDGITHPTRSSTAYLQQLLSKNDFHVLVAFHEEMLIGGLTAYELPMYKEKTNELFLYEIGVHPDYRKKGVAKKLIDYLRQIAIERGIREMYVGTERDNLPAQKLYRATGGSEQFIAWYVYTF